MKTLPLKALLSALLFAYAFVPAPAQTTPPGYWVVETNDRTRDHTLVQFYDLTDQLVYEERLEGVHLDVSRRKTRQLLNRTLRRVVTHTLLGSQLPGKETSPATLIAKKRPDTDLD
jgi:type IV secretory pathway VirD2 relaxase